MEYMGIVLYIYIPIYLLKGDYAPLQLTRTHPCGFRVRL